MKNRKIIVIVIIIGCLVVLNYSKCNYGTLRGNPELIDKQVYHVRKNYEFESTLYYDGNKSKPFMIQVEHETKSREFITSINIVDWYPTQSKLINLKNIKLTLKNKSKLLKEEKIIFNGQISNDNKEVIIARLPDNFTIEQGVDVARLSYSKLYIMPIKPIELQENIYIEFEIDGEKDFIEIEIPLKLRTEITILEMIAYLFKASI